MEICNERKRSKVDLMSSCEFIQLMTSRSHDLCIGSQMVQLVTFDIIVGCTVTQLNKIIQNHSVNKLKKLSCYRRSIIKTLLQVFGLYFFPVFKYLLIYFAPIYSIYIWSRHVGVPPKDLID